ncbi:aldo/keto reductase [Alicyclobacillus ferrooxydans]|uniref:Glyoxal reductase n=1 Tax=Alicyclobacillus ferrooxydans TaxID=471514 RepID=A0A0P9CG42_9BACL|nr:aldo/keto reductase [Alicyclobacillus ferrooxydans]KPV44532.1 glyoxal reductase [Alicyclobacillus ferrooxydans]
MAKSLTDYTVLNNGTKMPWFGLGVYKTQEGEEVIQSVRTALEYGYRSVDTAKLYENEEGVGQAVRESGIPRDEIFVTTKLWNTDQGYESALKAFEASRRRLGLEYVDLYLIHWPGKSRFKETWKAFERLYKDGLVRAIGVSNFHVHHLEALLADAEVVPAVNQIELHPRLTQVEVRDYCDRHDIRVEAWSPLMRGKLLNDPTVTKIAEAHEKSAAQVILRWDLDHGIITIPKSTHAHRIQENANVFDFTLTPDEIAALDALNTNERTGPNPDELIF